MAGGTVVETGIAGAFQITETGLRTIEPGGAAGPLVGAERPLSPFAAQSHDEQLPPNPLQASLEFARVHTAPPASRQAPQRIAIKPGDVIKLAQLRVRELNAEIRRLKSLERERDQLKRLLSAANTQKGKAAVRPLRSPSVG